MGKDFSLRVLDADLLANIQSKEFLALVSPPSQNHPLNINLSGITYKNPNYLIRRTNATELCCEYIISGSGYVVVDDVEYSVSEGDMVILQTGIDHLYYANPKDPYEKIWFNASGPLCGELMHLYGIGDKFIFKNAYGYPVMKQILDICSEQGLSGNKVNRLVTPLFIEIINIILKAEREHIEINQDAYKLKKYIDTNIDKNISIDLLAKQICKSKSQTSRIFKNAYDITPYDYLLEQRIEQAKLLLKSTTLSIKEITLHVGFSDEHYFSGLFKKKTNYTPSEYRRMNA